MAGDTFISCYPNAGLPNPMSETGFDETPEVTGALLEEFAQSGLPQHRRRLLRHHAGAHRRDRRGVWASTGRAAGATRCSRRCCRGLSQAWRRLRRRFGARRRPGTRWSGGGRFLSSSLSIATGPGTTRNVTASPGWRRQHHHAQTDHAAPLQIAAHRCAARRRPRCGHMHLGAGLARHRQRPPCPSPRAAAAWAHWTCRRTRRSSAPRRASQPSGFGRDRHRRAVEQLLQPCDFGGQHVGRRLARAAAARR